MRDRDEPRVVINAENYGERYVAQPNANGAWRHPLLEAAIERMRVPREPGRRGHDFLRGPGWRVDGHVSSRGGGIGRRARSADPRTAQPLRSGAHRARHRSRDAEAAKRDSGSACGSLRRHQLHRDARLSARLGVAHQRVAIRLVGAGAAAGADVPGQGPRLVANSREGHPRTGEQRTGLPQTQRAAQHRGALARCGVCRRFRRVRAGDGRQYVPTRPACTPIW